MRAFTMTARTVAAVAAVAASAVLMPLPASATAHSSGLTMTSSSVSITGLQDPVDGCQIGYSSGCGQVQVLVTVTGFAQYLGLDSMESLGYDNYPGWGLLTGTARVSGRVVCTTTGRSYRFAGPLNLSNYRYGYETALSPTTRISNDSATFTEKAGWDGSEVIPAGSCPADASGRVVILYRSVTVSDIRLTWQAVRPEYPASASFKVRGSFVSSGAGV